MPKIIKDKSSPLADYIRPVIDAKYRRRSIAAEDLGIDGAVLSRICSGNRPGVGEAVVKKICDRLSLDKDEGTYRLFLTKHRKVRKFFTESKSPKALSVVYSDSVYSKGLSKSYFPVPIFSINDLVDTASLFDKAKKQVLISGEITPKEDNTKGRGRKGKSIAISLPNGNIVGMSLEDKEPQDNKLFFLKWKGEIIIRKVFVKGNDLLFCPDDTGKDKIGTFKVKKSNYKKSQPIIGRIIWAIEKL
jgi:hypothetical protein